MLPEVPHETRGAPRVPDDTPPHSCTLEGKRTLRAGSNSSDAVCEGRTPPATLPEKTPGSPAQPPTTQPPTAWARPSQGPAMPPAEPPKGKVLGLPQQGPQSREWVWGGWAGPRSAALSPQAPSWPPSWAWGCAWACWPLWPPRWSCCSTTRPGGCPPTTPRPPVSAAAAHPDCPPGAPGPGPPLPLLSPPPPARRGQLPDPRPRGAVRRPLRPGQALSSGAGWRPAPRHPFGLPAPRPGTPAPTLACCPVPPSPWHPVACPAPF